jgi:hypothetical protein
VPCTLAEITTALALSLDDLGSYAVTSAATNTVRIANIGTTDTGASPNAYDGRWVSCLATGAASVQQRKVIDGGYATNGTLSLDVNWSLVPTANDIVHLTSYFPVIEQVGGEETSYRTIINRGLGRLGVVDSVDLAVTAGTESYSLATWADWLDRPERLLGVFEPGPTGGRIVAADWRGAKLVMDAELPRLELDAPFTGTLTLDVIRPARTWVGTLGVWAERDGLTNDADEVAVQLEDAVCVAKVEAYHVLMSRSPGRPNGDWSKKYEEALAEARSLRFYDMTAYRPQQSAPEAAA